MPYFRLRLGLKRLVSTSCRIGTREISARQLFSSTIMVVTDEYAQRRAGAARRRLRLQSWMVQGRPNNNNR